MASKRPVDAPQLTSPQSTELLRELVAHLRQHRTQLREEWANRITEARLLTAMTKEEIFAEATSVYDNYVEALATGTFQALQAYARNLSERIIPRDWRYRAIPSLSSGYRSRISVSPAPHRGEALLRNP